MELFHPPCDHRASLLTQRKRCLWESGSHRVRQLAGGREAQDPRTGLYFPQPHSLTRAFSLLHQLPTAGQQGRIWNPGHSISERLSHTCLKSRAPFTQLRPGWLPKAAAAGKKGFPALREELARPGLAPGLLLLPLQVPQDRPGERIQVRSVSFVGHTGHFAWLKTTMAL